MPDHDRRTVLTAAGSGLTALLAGCQGAGDSTTTATTETDAESSTTTAATGSTTTATSADTAEVKRRAREFVGLIADGSYETAHERFSPSVAEQITADQLRQVWTGFEDEYGAFRVLTGLEVTSQGDREVVTGVAEFARGRLEVIVAFGPEGIAGFRLRPPAGNWSPPPYADQLSFAEREVTLRATDSCALGGTLTLPEGVERAPGVVLVHGQGPSDRDGTVGPNKPYKDLAWGLASRGVAVLRYEKRTAACEVDFAEITIDEAVTNDALAAVERLRETEIVADGDVVVAGHSIGGTLAPRIAARDDNLAGVVMLAPLARSAGRAILDQNEYLANRDGTVTEAERDRLEQVRQVVQQIRSLDFPDDEVVFLGGDEYWRTLAEYDHLATARRLDVPRLLLFGERDYQVTVEDDLPLWKNALADESNVTVRRYDRLNHLFMPGTGKPGNAEYLEQNNVAKRVVVDLAAFAVRVTGVDVGPSETTDGGTATPGTTTGTTVADDTATGSGTTTATGETDSNTPGGTTTASE
ncbi:MULTISPECIES: alpha/beta fold hydrolase [Halorussus]|uniref:alpha/beta hydrolase n=1 Tax=Halorussus TaxID=1070314 RepID=UPI000E21ACB2|nr:MULTISPECIES: alpha/beta fold hydrolase [Halorussus]NHN58887.1 alpha/beta fold hydrolase [Halorussus sp. JP-T4]